MKRFTILSTILTFLLPIVAFGKPKMTEEEKMGWWQDARFGMFVHWGPYCMYGGVYNGHHQRRGGAEWIMNRCKIPVREYRATASRFNPRQFNADSLVAMAKDAGMKYIVFTTKHHDGFAMFKSDASNFNIVDYTDYGRDIVDEVVKACRRQGMKVGFYYSQSQDWCNPGGATARKQMWEGWENRDSIAIDTYTKEHNGAWDYLQTTCSFNDYFHDIALPQMKELLSRYGEDLGVIFFDTPMAITKEQATEMTELLKDYPHVIVNDRLRRPDFPGDYKTPEGRIPKKEDVDGIYWETCMNIGSSWGYKSWEGAWKSGKTILRNLLTIASMGGNYLLNVGPDPQGQIPVEARNCLKEVGEWLKKNGEAVYGTRRSNIVEDWGVVTLKESGKGSTAYLCVFDVPESGEIRADLGMPVKGAAFLADGRSVDVASKGKTAIVKLPRNTHTDPIATVIKLDLKGKLPPERLISNSEKVFKILDTD